MPFTEEAEEQKEEISTAESVTEKAPEGENEKTSDAESTMPEEAEEEKGTEAGSGSPGASDAQNQIETAAETEKPAPAAMTQPMLVFCGLPNRVLDGFLADMKARKIRVPIKAVLTEHNVSWTLRALYGELRGEHAALTGEKL